METFEEKQLQGIARVLVRENVLQQADALHYQTLAATHKLSLPQYLVNHHILSATVIAQTTALHFGLPIIDLQDVDINAIPTSRLTEKQIDQLLLVPFMPLYIQHNELFIATDDPCNQSVLKEISFYTGFYIHLRVVKTDALYAFITRFRHQKESVVLTHYFQNTEKWAQLEQNDVGDDAPIIALVNQIILECLKKKASDIHFEPYENSYRIRYRQDGLLRLLATPPTELSLRIAARLKIMSNLDISEKRVPQDGRLHVSHPETKTIHFRISTCPTINGEKIVIRILDPQVTQISIDRLGLSDPQKQAFLTAIHKPQGLILVTGPTGSGKTVTLYSALSELNTLDKNISSVEDPVEIRVPGINQVSINPKAGLTFSHTLRSFLRQDPDIIMVGEIRDRETAEIAINAAQTGHLVLSTLHTNSAAQAPVRLMNMGIAPYQVASAVSLIMAQRLVRRVSADGYQGRLGLFEVLPISPHIAELLGAGGNAHELLKMARSEGMFTLHQMGLEYVKSGITTREEIHRVTVE